MFKHLVKKKDQKDEPWSFAKHIPMPASGTFELALTAIKNNPTSNEDKIRPSLYYMDDDIVRGSTLRSDYEFPYLHQFMRLRATTISIWPKYIKHVRPRQSKGEQFVCMINGHMQYKMISPTFAQNVYQGVFEDLNPTDLPEDISFFKDQPEKYPLLSEVK